jgi:hypothetical protein
MTGIFFESSASLPLREGPLALGEVYLNVTENPSIIFLSQTVSSPAPFPSFEAYRICYKEGHRISFWIRIEHQSSSLTNLMSI